MKLTNKADSKTSHAAKPAHNPVKKSERLYGYGLGHFIKFKQRYCRPTDKEINHSFERGYN
ncbi:hypothetical protein FT643_02505 [Ketobacter sp. MCCC 1A13808]|uniref:hypothetical protein n=1 Tax=Ketobacter sp. MCCC 1A13808 TaxID=2602738 RepID=UPI000F243A42|nr:hypothetical protein [Ketobacter sp. MCCC 1A13808]MVF11005.1 hypothetical protein [Ketobacter sp. MCCC 1A13808]RLP56391.1 MAG: hypothetical protein D6160_03100 [Ketobacter sp.]